jgi:DNA-binding transcriptional LysR family regulator
MSVNLKLNNGLPAYNLYKHSLMEFRLNDLRNFVGTTGCRTLVEAAKKLEISQPALSMSIRRLEMDCGAALFFRSRTGIQLTPSGRTLLIKAKKVLDSIELLDWNESDDAIFRGRSISIGCHSTVASYSLPKSLFYLAKKAPDFQIEIKHGFSRDIQIAVQNGLIDVGIVINPSRAPDLVISKLGRDMVAVWKSEDTNTDTVICDPALFQSQSILKHWIDKPKKIIATDSLDLIARLTHEGLGYGILPSRAIELTRMELIRVNGAPTYADQIALVHRPEFGKTTPEKLLIQSIRQAFQPA